MKKLSLRLRMTLVSSLFLLLSCIILTSLSNVSAGKIIDAVEVLPSTQPGSTPALPLEPSISCQDESLTALHQTFYCETVLATIFIVLIGSAATYLASGYILKPICSLTQEVKRRSIQTLDQPIPVPKSSDEIQELTLSFNQMLEELQHSFQLQKQFSADAAHELRTPLAVMQTKLDVFSMSHANSSSVQELTGDLYSQLDRLTKLIEELLLFSQDLPLVHATQVSLPPLLEDVVSELEALAEQKTITLKLSHCDGIVMGQDQLLERVFYNLLENAIKYSPPQTTVQIWTEQPDDGLIVLISDEGEGIPTEYQEAIFQPFFRIDKSRSRLIGGSGLGLAVCHKILQRHHASICVYPNSPRGSVFRIHFPLNMDFI